MTSGVNNAEKQHGIRHLTVKPDGFIKREPFNPGPDKS